MKKEKFYSIAYAFVLTLILVGTSLSAQYASLDMSDFAVISTLTEETTTATWNTKAIDEISTQLKGQLDFYNEVLDIPFYEDALIRVDLTEEGKIVLAEVVEGGNSNLNRLIVNIINKIDRVTPIAKDGQPLAETIWIPLKFK